jgi:hypothetical protein
MTGVCDAAGRATIRGHASVRCAPPAQAGMISGSPNALLGDGTDWRFVNELKHELKA